MAQTTSLVFNGGVIPSPSPAPSGSGKAKLLKIGEITVTEQEVQVTKKVICDPDSVTTVAPFMEVLTSARLAELISANNILVLDDGTMQYLMSDSTITVEDGTSVCTAVNFLGLSKENRAKVLYPCTRLTDELTLQQVLEVGEPVETDFNLVKACPEDTEPGTLIDKLEVVDNVRDPDDPDDQPLLHLEVTVDGQGNRKVGINEDTLKTFSENVLDSIETLTEFIDECPSDEHGYFNSSLYTTPGDGTTTNLVMDEFRISKNRDVHGDSIEFVPTHQEGGVDFGEVWLEPGTYILATQFTLQWVGNPRGTFLPLVANVADQPFDFSYEHEDVVRTTRIITKTTRGKLLVNIAIDADTPPMGVWVKNLEVAQIASLTQSNVAHDTTLTGTGNVGDPLGVMPAAFGKIKNIPTSISQFRNGDVIPVDGPNGPAKMPASGLQDAILGGPVGEAVQAWLDEHPEATTTVQDHSLTDKKLVIGTLNFVTPEMFGAVGDGVADDTTAINSMLAGGDKFCLFKNGSTYKVNDILEVDSDTIIELNNCIVSSTNDGHIFRFKGASTADRKKNFAIRNGTIVGNGLDSHTGDQGAAIQGFYADNIIIENIKTDHTYGDGLQFRETSNVRVKSCKIDNFGRNGVSPTSGSFVFEDIEVKSALAGANPGNTFDCEPNTAAEPTRLVLRDSKLPRATLVDFYSAENDKFIIDALIENVEFTEAYPNLKIVKSRKGDASNVIIRNCSFVVMSNAVGLHLENVLNVHLEGCKFRYAVNAGGNTHAIDVASDNVSLKIKDVDCTGLSRAIFAYNRDIVGWEFDGFKGSIYTRVFQNNELKNSDVSGFETTAPDTSENYGNVCIECSVPESLRQFVTFGKGGSPFGGLLASNEFVRNGTSAFDVFIPLPSIDETKGHCYFLSIGYSHRGRPALSGQKLVSILAQESYAGVTLTDVFTTGNKTITISQAPGKRGLVASFEATTSGVVVSYTLFG